MRSDLNYRPAGKRTSDVGDLITIPTTVLATNMSHALSGSTENSGASIVMELNLYIYVSCTIQPGQTGSDSV